MEKEVAAMGSLVNKRRRKSGNDEAEGNAPPKVLRKDHAAFRPTQITLKGKSLALMRLDVGPAFSTPATHPDPLSYAKSSRKTATEIPTGNVATTKVQGLFSAKSPKSGKSTSFPFVDGSPGDHIVPSGYFSELRHLPNTDFLSQYNINLARQVAMGFQLGLRFEQEVRLLKKATAKIARRDKMIQGREEKIKKLD
ncbi:hypothetical protein Tco_0594198 [Tanacetum coccineum]